MGLIELRKIEALREVAATMSRNPNVAYLPNGNNNLLLGLNAAGRYLNVNQVEGTVILSDPSPLPVLITTTVSIENENRVVADEDKSDQGAPTRFRKPPLPLQPVQRRLGHDVYDLPSPDSVARRTYRSFLLQIT